MFLLFLLPECLIVRWYQFHDLPHSLCSLLFALFCHRFDGNMATDRVRERQHARHEATAAQNGTGAGGTTGKPNTGSKEKKVGYVPREKAQLVASGLSSGGMMGKQGVPPDTSQELDEATASRLERVMQADDEIDASVDQLSHTISNLSLIAGAMGSEARLQNAKIDQIDKRLTHVNEKQIVVNARMRSLLKHS
jgi:hypothetical protein